MRVMKAPSADPYVGTTILSQIKAQDYWALAAWGARDVFVFEDPLSIPDQYGRRFDLGERGGGVLFKVRGTRKGYGKAAKIVVGLQWDDTYTVVGGRTHRGVWKTLDVAVNVYFDHLVQVIDSFVR